jgi:flagellar hook-associated protein 1 FlgK
MGLNSALGVAARSLEVFTAGINVAGQNISNANTPGYIREQMLLEANQPYQQGALVFGTGAFVAGVVQQIDLFLETRIHSANSDYSASAARDAIYKQLEVSLSELGDGDLSTGLNQFLATINDVVNQPESSPLRQLVVAEGSRFAGDIAALRSQIDELRGTQTIAVNQLVDEANTLINRIAELNPQIARLESAGLLRSDAGALRTQRYNALSRLSEIVPIRFIERKDGAVDVFSGSDFLIITGQTQQLETVSSVDRNISVTNVQLSITKSALRTNGGGELAGIVNGRDTILGGFIDQLDQYSSNLIYEFNKVHASGEGLEGFSSVTSDVFATDTAAALNSTAAGIPFTPVHGSFQLKVTNKQTDTTVTTNIAVDLDGIGTDTTLSSLQASLNAVGDITANINAAGQLEITADPNFEFRFSDDTSGALAALGINTFFTGSNSSNIAVNSVVANDHRFFAASQGGGPSDGSNALEMLGFIEKPVTALNGENLDEFYEIMVGDIVQGSASEGAIAEGLNTFRESLQNQRDQFSGVSLDEEAVKVLEFQRSFQAAARLISTIDELFTVLLTM